MATLIQLSQPVPRPRTPRPLIASRDTEQERCNQQFNIFNLPGLCLNSVPRAFAGLCFSMATSSLEMLIEGVCLEHFRNFLIHSLYYLVDCLLPRLLLVSFRVDCIEKVSQRFLDHLSEYLRELMERKRVGYCCGLCLWGERVSSIRFRVGLLCFINHSRVRFGSGKTIN